jgi:xanthine dehydrogenase YagS FAD-binding subunit
MHAILGTSEHCIATHASDLAVALVALDAVVYVRGAGGERAVPLTGFYRTPGEDPSVENALEPGELITSVEVPLLPEGARSGYLKIRDRASYEFALASAAVAVVIRAAAGPGGGRARHWPAAAAARRPGRPPWPAHRCGGGADPGAGGRGGAAGRGRL